MKKLPISVSIISGAEARRIGRTLESVAGWTSEITVVLNQEVNDGTEEIALSHGAKVFREPWKGFLGQKKSAEQKATQEWILGLDADEVVSPQLRDEIIELFDQPGALESAAAFCFPRLTIFCGRWIRHGDWYPDRQTRLWHKGRAHWDGMDPHPRLEVQGPVRRLRSDLLHYNAAGIDDQIAKISVYSNDFVRESRQRPPRGGVLGLAIRPWWRFFRSYVFRLGFLDGWQGYYLAWMTAAYTVTRYAKEWYARHPGDAAAAENPPGNTAKISTPQN